VNETGGKQDEEDGQADPGQVLQERICRQITVHPHSSWFENEKRKNIFMIGIKPTKCSVS
jgi:hypothetical protein